MDIQAILLIVTSIISGASIILKTIAPLTKTKKDDKILNFLLTVMKFLSLHTEQDNKVKVVVKNK